MQWVLLRHGIAIDRDDPACPAEADRHLTERGIERTRLAARGLLRLGVSPDRILSSPWLRARQTAEIAAEELGFDPAAIGLDEALLPFVPVEELLPRVEACPDRTVLVCGHAPHLDELLAALTGTALRTRLKKAGAACVLRDGRSDGALEWLLPPRVLRVLGEASTETGA